MGSERPTMEAMRLRRDSRGPMDEDNDRPAGATIPSVLRGLWYELRSDGITRWVSPGNYRSDGSTGDEWFAERLNIWSTIPLWDVPELAAHIAKCETDLIADGILSPASPEGGHGG